MSTEPRSESLLFTEQNVIYVYTRAQAIADGVLFDATELAREAGFRYPVALTAAVWAECVAWEQEDSRRQIHQDVTGRLWDVLWMASVAIRALGKSSQSSRLPFRLLVVPRDGKSRRVREVELHVHIGPGDQAEPVMTIMMPGED